MRGAILQSKIGAVKRRGTGRKRDHQAHGRAIVTAEDGVRESRAVADRGGDVGEVIRDNIRDTNGDEVAPQGGSGIADKDMPARLKLERRGHSRGDGGTVSARIDQDALGRRNPGGEDAVRMSVVDTK